MYRVMMRMNLAGEDFHCFKYFGHNDKKNASRMLEIIKIGQILEELNNCISQYLEMSFESFSKTGIDDYSTLILKLSIETSIRIF